LNKKIEFFSGPSNSSRSELLVIGEYRGIQVGVEEWTPPEEFPSLLEISRLYIEAAFGLEPGFRASAINASYARNNIPYLERELEESGDMFRVFVPFSGDEDCLLAKDAHTVAGMRPLLTYGQPAEDDVLVLDREFPAAEQESGVNAALDALFAIQSELF